MFHGFNNRVLRTGFFALGGLISFFALGGLISLGALVLSWGSSYFSYAYRVAEMPIGPLVAGLFLVGLLFAGLGVFLRNYGDALSFGRKALFLFLLIGLLPRLVLLFSEPVLEDDYQRYLWDGAVLSEGFNPYHYRPQDILDGQGPARLLKLADEASPLLERVNHPQLRTIYPPGAEFFFALAHQISPFSLTAWRGVILTSEVISLLLLLAILTQLGRSPAFAALYWWNPLVMKELINSAHMEGVLVPFLMAAFLALLRGRYFISLTALLLAASVKLWPALLVPLLLKKLAPQRNLFLAGLLLCLLAGFFIALPFYLSGFDQSSGLVVYAEKWKTNALLMPLLEEAAQHLLPLIGAPLNAAPLLARAGVGLFLLFLVFLMVRQPLAGRQELLERLFFLSAAFFLLSPAQFPWYFLWVAPLLPLYPLWGFLALVPLMAFYYAGFAFMAEGVFSTYRYPLAFTIWMPVWGLLLFEWMINRRRQACAMKNS